jgi:hypothetical protein
MSETNSDRDLSIQEWCLKRDVSKSSFYKLQRLGFAPKVLRIPGTNIGRITLKADREWEAAMGKLAAQKAAKLERERRIELARAAGNAAALSPLHVSRRPRNRDGHNT